MYLSMPISIAKSAIISGCLFVLSSNAATNTPTPDDLVTFFKQTVKSPPDVEAFVGIARNLRTSDLPASFANKTFQRETFYEGARAGTNFFLRRLNDRLSPAVDPSNTIYGREATNIFLIYDTTITSAIGTNSKVIQNDLFFGLLSHFLNMGLIKIRPGSVEWENNQFHAADIHGEDIFGRLEVSNNLPVQLAIARTKGGSPYKEYKYFYPEPTTALSGFPRKVVLLTSNGHGLSPLSEFELSSIHLAEKPLSNGFFSHLKYTGPTIMHSNLYSNADLYVSLENGNMMKVPILPREAASSAISVGRKRFILYVFLVTLAIGPIVVFLVTWRIKKQNKPNIKKT